MADGVFTSSDLENLKQAIVDLSTGQEEVEIRDAHGNIVQFQRKDLADLKDLYDWVAGKVTKESSTSQFVKVKLT